MSKCPLSSLYSGQLPSLYSGHLPSLYSGLRRFENSLHHSLWVRITATHRLVLGVQELDSSEKQWVEVCGQIDKLDKFFPLGSLAMTKAREAQAAAIARGMICLVTWPT